ncbi:MAG: minor capsid protein [Oscillospiraceae bacterium]
MRDNAEYWIERALQREYESYLEGAELSEKLFAEYQLAARRIRAKVGDFYARYATEQGISMEEAVKTLNLSEMQEWKKTLGDYMADIKAAADDEIRAKLQAELDALSYNSQISRLEVLEGQVNMELNTLYDKGVEQMKEQFGDMFEEGYYKKVYDLQQRVGFMGEFAHVSTSMVEDIVSYPWSGANFSDRLWRNKQALIFSTREILTRGAIEGTSIGQMSKLLSDIMGQSYKNAQRLVLTESAHFHEEATFRAYKAAGVKEYEYQARLSEKTCAVCGALDGKHFAVEERQEGSNAPPLHPNCHCITVEHDPEEALDWINSGKEMPHRMTYEEWAAEQGVKTKAATGPKGIKTDPRYNADAKQYASYADMLGDDAPADIAAFRDLKYNDTDKWDMMKLDYRRRSALQNGGTPLPHIDAVSAADGKFEKYLFNKDNPSGYAKGQALQSVLGYSKENWKDLRQNIIASAAKYPAKEISTDAFGTRYEQKMVLYGPSGRAANVVVGWNAKDGKQNLTSVYIKEVKKNEN